MKHVFFDIDGTLWDRRNVIPQSTSDAIGKLRENGHKAYICTGRTRGYITDPALLSLGFDGIISGLGTGIEADGDMVFEHIVPAQTAVRTVDTVKRYKVRAILEGPEYLYLDYDEFKDDPYGRKVMGDLQGRMKSLSDNYGRWVINKLSCDTTGCDKKAFYAELEEYYDFIEHNDVVVEMVPKGFSKGTGINRLCEIKGIDKEDTVAIGDAANDVEMFKAAGFSIAMGSGAEGAKEAADYVTSGLHEDGIMNALKYMKLI